MNFNRIKLLTCYDTSNITKTWKIYHVPFHSLGLTRKGINYVAFSLDFSKAKEEQGHISRLIYRALNYRVPFFQLFSSFQISNVQLLVPFENWAIWGGHISRDCQEMNHRYTFQYLWKGMICPLFFSFFYINKQETY